MGVIPLNVLTRVHRDRAELIQGLRLLFTGDHRAYFVEAGRSDFPFRPIAEGGKPFYTPCDLLGLISRKTADLLFGEAPRLGHPDPATADAIAAIAERSNLHGELMSVAMEVSWAGESYLEAVFLGGQAYLRHVPAQEIFPVGVPGVDGQYATYERYTSETVIESGKEVTLLLKSTYTTGQIERSLEEVATSTIGVNLAAVRRKAELSRWPVPLVEREPTGLNRPSLIRCRGSAAGDSDYTRVLIELQDMLNAKQTQLSRVILKHADPKLFMVQSQASPNGSVRAEDDVLYGDSMEAKPQYLTWEAQLEAAMRDRDYAMTMLATAAEMPLSFLGVKSDATSESASKMRLNAVNAVSKAQRKAAYITGAIRLAIQLALSIELYQVERQDLIVQTRDGLPDDELDRANVIATLRTAGAISLRRSLAMQQLDDAEIDAEIEAIQDEQRNQTPGTLLGENTAPGFASGPDQETTDGPRQSND